MPGIVALAVAYVLSQFYRSFLAVLTPALTAELGATKGDLSLASGVYFLTFALAQFGIGVSLDRFGPRRTGAILLAMGGAGGAFLFAAATKPVHDHRRHGADRHRLRARADGVAVHLRAQSIRRPASPC